ncbi:MAG: hypothetical protein AAF542_21920 [Pseudomonadota bacterium]
MVTSTPHFLDRCESMLRAVESGDSCASIARRDGFSSSLVRHTVRLARKLSTETKALCRQRVELSMGHARVLASLDAKDQEEFARRVLAHGWSVRQLEDRIRRPDENVPDSYFDRLSEHMSEQFGHPITVTQDRSAPRNGRIIIRYVGFDDFDNVCSKLGVTAE